MERKEQRILHCAEKAGLKLARKTGHVPSKEELLRVKIQVVPSYARWLMLVAAVVGAIATWHFLENDQILTGPILGLLSFVFMLFSIFGVRRTLETVVDQCSIHVVDLALEAIGGLFGSLLD